ncbi:hypothetical protein P9112_010288 [Eukaryota sp. TZLM1-RC]
MSDIFEQDISDSTSSSYMQLQEPAPHIQTHDKEDNKVTDTDPTSSSPTVKDVRTDKIPPSSFIKEVTRTDPAPSPFKEKGSSVEVYENGRGSLSPRKKGIVRGGNENGPSSLSPPKYRICRKGNRLKTHLRHVIPTRKV